MKVFYALQSTFTFASLVLKSSKNNINYIKLGVTSSVTAHDISGIILSKFCTTKTIGGFAFQKLGFCIVSQSCNNLPLKNQSEMFSFIASFQGTVSSFNYGNLRKMLSFSFQSKNFTIDWISVQFK